MGRSTAHRLDQRLHILDFFSAYALQNGLQAGRTYGDVGVMVDYVDAADVVRLQSSFLAQETYDIHLAKFVLLSTPYVERSPNRTLRGDRLIIDADFSIGINKIGQRLGRTFDNVSRPLVVPTRGATGAMREVVGVEAEDDNGTTARTSGMSNPRAARSVATSTLLLPARNLYKERSRSSCSIPPW